MVYVTGCRREGFRGIVYDSQELEVTVFSTKWSVLQHKCINTILTPIQ